ncbi:MULTISPECIES: 16S rRNA (uracil(1498)-N(3))-methyltransferase [Alphaproteobacteria]|uniref:16S rRNA (uracil(1498)-N(3))-methyltransferase n=1 Tax=Alphaproteobacteria TaxID=28211 RepID=UPI00273144C4|nr:MULTISPECIES: 16S rRNA (uracil(1498)-N(3))-methyltransferase [Alphaproteobacteria]MDP1626718.1 16S rRNA (uracil(1498)-N(3))-methyltransferase [Parvibaculum sp.]MDP2213851.1 16S rRNA (uracil(1498)-N(3))-methyltransferase [Phenylobacterium sp.]MDP3327323.1 16S rRNA (uracil(1498)-N(3))-methyltransferase [Parvibaculum sp.]
MAREDSDDTHDTPRCASGKARLYVEGDLGKGASLTLDRDQSHYLVNVLRMGADAQVLLFNGRDGEWAARIAEPHKKNCVLELVARTRAQEPLPDVWLLFAPVKKARLDFIAQKATEMGAAVIQPVITERTVVTRLKDERLQANAVEAAEQCGLVAVPEVREAEKLGSLLAKWEETAPGRRILFCDESEEPGAAREALARLAAEGWRGAPLAVLIGPEGGFSPKERELLRGRKDTAVLSLGPRIMRADTAAIAALAVVGLALGDW